MVRSVWVGLLLVCEAFASIAEAEGLEYGPRIAISIPTQQALTSAIDYGLTATFMKSPRRGFGVDIGYHRWPGSLEVDRAMDELLGLVSGAPISGTRTTVSDAQATIHGKFFALDKRPLLPWMKIGVGVHRLNAKLELPVGALQAAGVRVPDYTPDHISHELGFQVGAGVDFAILADTKLSLDASYHFMTNKEDLLTAFTIGASLLDSPR